MNILVCGLLCSLAAVTTVVPGTPLLPGAPAPAVATPPMKLPASSAVTVHFHTTLGDVDARLWPDRAPKTVANFVALARQHFYDGLTFDKVIPGLAVETGDPTGRGDGGPGYCIADEFSPAARHDRPGILTMASTGPDSGGSRFLFTLAAAPVLDGRSPAFGEVTSGLAVVRAVASQPPGVTPRLLTVEVSGPAAATDVPRVKAIGEDELKQLATAPARKLLTGVGTALGLGRLERVTVSGVRRRCGEGQVEVSADFAKERAVRLLVYGGVSPTGVFKVRQFQVGRGEEVKE